MKSKNKKILFLSTTVLATSAVLVGCGVELTKENFEKALNKTLSADELTSKSVIKVNLKGSDIENDLSKEVMDAINNGKITVQSVYKKGEKSEVVVAFETKLTVADTVKDLEIKGNFIMMYDEKTGDLYIGVHNLIDIVESILKQQSKFVTADEATKAMMDEQFKAIKEQVDTYKEKLLEGKKEAYIQLNLVELAEQFGGPEAGAELKKLMDTNSDSYKALEKASIDLVVSFFGGFSKEKFDDGQLKLSLEDLVKNVESLASNETFVKNLTTYTNDSNKMAGIQDEMTQEDVKTELSYFVEEMKTAVEDVKAAEGKVDFTVDYNIKNDIFSELDFNMDIVTKGNAANVSVAVESEFDAKAKYTVNTKTANIISYEEVMGLVMAGAMSASAYQNQEMYTDEFYEEESYVE